MRIIVIGFYQCERKQMINKNLYKILEQYLKIISFFPLRMRLPCTFILKFTCFSNLKITSDISVYVVTTKTYPTTSLEYIRVAGVNQAYHVL